jgi:hypothetical protein
MRTHIQILAYIYLILGSVGVLVAIFMVLMGIDGSEPLRNGVEIGLFSLFVLIPCLLSLTLVFAYRGLLKRRHWGRVLGIGVSAFWLLLGFTPMPSIYGLIFLLVGVYGLIVLLWPAAAREFS